MNTTTGKTIALERHEFMLSFLMHFFKETGHQNKDSAWSPQ
jgi:HD superfamily phosphodiesterase